MYGFLHALVYPEGIIIGAEAAHPIIYQLSSIN